MRPTQPGPVWTSVATGKLPYKTGVRSSAVYTPLAGYVGADSFVFRVTVSHGAWDNGFVNLVVVNAPPAIADDRRVLSGIIYMIRNGLQW